LGEAKRTILTVLIKSNERVQGRGIATKAGYKYGSLRHHFGELQTWGFIDRTKDGYAITPTGAALVQCERV
jgi:predicted transcriptional regulator